MALVLADRVKETASTTGTGTWSLAGAVADFQSFVTGIGTGNITYYSAADGTSGWEVGIGTVTSGSPNTLSRTTVLASSAAGAKVSFTVAPIISAVAPAALYGSLIGASSGQLLVSSANAVPAFSSNPSITNLTVGGTLTYGGVTLTNAVTGTGKMVLDTNPTLASLSLSTSLTNPLLIGGTLASSTLTIESTSGAGTSDAIIFKTGSQVERFRLDTSGNAIHTSAAANALAVGPNGTTNPAFSVDASTATSATGINVKSAAAAGGCAVSVTSSGTNENLKLDAKGTGTITIGSVSTGGITLTRATTMSAALTYGGVTLSNAVTGTGNMVLASSPSLTSATSAGLTVTGSFTATGLVGNASLTNSSVTICGSSVSLGSSLSTFSGAATFSSTVATGALTVTGAITATGNITAFFSDDRLKTRLGTIESALDKIDSLTGFVYRPNETGLNLGAEDGEYVGLSAQDMQKVMPQVVKPSPLSEDYLAIQYDQVVPLLVQAIKELRAEVENIREQLLP